jgi:hypothetical protein
VSTGHGWAPAPKKEDLPLFVLGVTGTKEFDDAAAVARTLSRLTARVATAHRVVIHTGCGHPADRHARDFADGRKWLGATTQVAPPGLRSREVTLRALCGLVASCDAVLLFTRDKEVAEFAAAVGKRVGAEVRVTG